MQRTTPPPEQSPPLAEARYRADIDGLRAVAVLGVVGFHAFPGWVQGGYVGVDVFFVISGYLISTIILGGLRAGTFSFATFYARRIKRIFPALLLVLCACLAFSWFALFTDEYRQLGKHVAGGAGFVANLILRNEAGYFDNAADTKPLMHLWSLGIEEQFYFIWPLLLFLAWRRGLHPLVMVLAVAAVSFALNIRGVGRDAVGTFYSPQTRFWELLVGAVLAQVTLQHANVAQPPGRQSLGDLWGPSPDERLGNLKSVLGCSLIAAGMLLLTRARAFPGGWALLPTLGAFFVISAGPRAWLNRVVLSHPLMVWVGLISFPLYLWHWPLLSLAHIIVPSKPSVALRLGAILASFILAWLTYRLLEQPIRHGGRGGAKVAVLCTLMLLVGGAGYAAYHQDGVPTREIVTLNPSAKSLVLGAGEELVEQACGVSDEERKVLQSCYRSRGGAPRYALWGDSKAHALFWGLVRESTDEQRWLFLGNMVPVVSTASLYQKDAEATRVAMKTLLAHPDLEVVVLATAIRALFSLAGDEHVEDLEQSPNLQTAFQGLSESIRQLLAAGKAVVFVIDNPTFPDPRRCLTGRITAIPAVNRFLGHEENPRCAMTYEGHLALTRKYRELVTMLQTAHPRLTVYDPTPLLCDVKANLCRAIVQGTSLYSYTDHISDVSNTRIARELLPLLDSVSRRAEPRAAAVP
ncbi:MAG: acyltransferase family protein [Myxococcota bacterium]